MTEEQVDSVINFAAESHVDRSIMGPSVFVETNVNGTLALLEAAREHSLARFVQVSIDEVYGSLGPAGAFTESSPIEPNSPYAASKAAADLLVRAHHKTYGIPAIITRSSNNYGPRQFPEKLNPLMIVHALADKKLPVYGDGQQVRDWIHVEDHVLKHLDSKSRTLLDVGCGRGHFLNEVAKVSDLELTGCDLFEDVPLARGRFVRGTAEKLPFADQSFDIVICSHTLEQIVDIKKAVAELFRVARR